MQTSIAKKFFAVGSAAAMALAAFAPFAAHAAVHAAGTNVSSSDGTVWMIMPDGTRRAYTSAGAFLSYGFNSFASVVTASAEDLALPAGSFIPPQDGKIICSDRGSDKGTCYLITGAQKGGFTSAAVFTGLGFSFSRATYGDVSWMSSTSNIDNTTMAHRAGVLVNNGGTVQLVGTNGLLGIPDLATFNSWGYSFADVVPANASDKTMTQTGVMAARVAGQLSPTATTGGTTPPPSGPPVISGSVSASLAGDSPATGTLAVSGTNGASTAGNTIATLANFAFNGTGTVTQVQIKRIGVSSDSILPNVYLFNGGTRLTDAASVGANSTITFNNPNGLFTVNGSMELSVVAEVLDTATAGNTVGMQLVSYTVANGTPATASISGNLMTTATASDLAYANFGTVQPTGASFDPSNDVQVYSSSITINQRDMTMSRFIMRNIGSAQQGDLNNFRLRVDGNQIAQVQSMDSSGYVYFSFSPVTMKSGTRALTVLANVISGSSRNFQFQVRNKVDVAFTDTQYNVSTSPSTSTSFPVGSAASNSINSGTITFQRATNSPTGNVTDGSSGVTLANYTITAFGEPMQIQTLTVGATSSTSTVGSLRNGRLLINGTQYGSNATLASTTGASYTGGGTSFTLNYTVQPGSPITLSVVADLFDNDAGGNSLTGTPGTTVTAVILPGSSNIQKMASLGYVSGPTSAVVGNNITDVTGAITLSKNATYANQTPPLPQTAYKLGAFNLVGSTSEDVNVTSIDLAIAASSSLANLTNVKLLVNGNIFGTIKGTVTLKGLYGAQTSATTTYSGNFTLPKNTTVPVELWSDIGTPTTTPYTSDTLQALINVNGTTVSSSQSVNIAAAGQTITGGSGAITASKDPSSPVAAITAGNQTKTAAAFKWTTTNDTQTITDITLSLAANSTVQSVSLWDGATQVGSTQPGTASTTFSNLSIVIPPNSTKILTVQLQLGNVGTGAGTSGDNVQVSLDNYKSTASSTGVNSKTSHGTAVQGNALYVYKSIPTITNVTLPTSVLSAGTATLAKFSMSSGGSGTIGWTHILFTIATSSHVAISSPQLWDADAGTQIVGNASTTNNSTLIYVAFDSNTEQQISGAKNYILKATVTGVGTGIAAGDYVTTSIGNPMTSFTAPTNASTVSSTTASLVWSDVSAQSHSLTTTDWNNDYLVKNLPTDSQTISK